MFESGQDMNDMLLSADGLTVSFKIDSGFLKKSRKLQAVRHVSFELKTGECIGIVGESGCGKSTLARAVLGFAPLEEGHLIWKGRDIAGYTEQQMAPLRQEIQIIFQNPLSSLNPRMTVGDIVMEPLDIFRPELSKKEKAQLAGEWFEKVGLNPDMMSRYPNEFSGGQAQRIAIARAMIGKPELLICDEAVAALDVSVKAQIINLLKKLQRETGISLIFISHDLATVRRVSDRILVMYLGSVMEVATASEIFSDPLHPYTQALISALPVPDPEIELTRESIVLGTELPSPMNPPSGCVFRTRCPIAKPNCITTKPTLETKTGERSAACHYSGTKISSIQNQTT